MAGRRGALQQVRQGAVAVATGVGGRLFWGASLAQGLREVMVLWAVSLALLYGLRSFSLLSIVGWGFFPLGPGGALLCALRLQIPPGTLQAQVKATVRQALLLGGTLTLMMTPPFVMVLSQVADIPLWFGVVMLLMIGVMTGFTFFMVRMGLLLWRTLGELRHRHLRWGLTYAHLLLIGGIILVVAPWASPETAATNIPENPLLAALMMGISDIVAAAIFTVVTLAIVLPPLALFSYVVSRRTTGRLETLVAATGALRAGDYGARVSVVGQDEVAQLQADFNAMAATLEETLRALEAERQKSERLLHNILPPAVAERLKAEERTVADSFEEVTVLFADIVDFTPLSAGITAPELVAFLNQVFSAFDQLAEDYHLEKIKTIGDAYMVVGGLPMPGLNHAEAIAEMALAMQAKSASLRTPQGKPLCLRIGIHTGPVVAGVIGIKKFSYDLWGDTVNTASRMESHGVPGAIQVTQSTYERLQARYRMEPRGTVVIKGKGEMPVYLLTGPTSEP